MHRIPCLKSDMIVAPIQIGVAVVMHNGHYLVGKRQTQQTLSGYWEFPGGKCHINESPQHCAERECLEETGLTVIADCLRYQTVHHYAHGPVHLHFFTCTLSSHKEEPCPPFLWIDIEGLRDLTFPEANQKLIYDLLQE